MTGMQNFYKIKGCCPDFWDGQESVIHGIISKGQRIQLSRSGSAVPVFSVPVFSPLLVTEEGKALLLESKFRGLSFQAVDYDNIVDIGWHTWEEEEEIPEDEFVFDFASVILDSTKHRPDLMLDMPKMFEVITEFTVVPLQEYWKVDMAGHEGQRIVNVLHKDGSIRYSMVSQEGKEWFLENGEGWLEFIELEVTS